MLTLPEIEKRKAQPYIFVPFTVTMRQMQKPARDGFPLIFAHLEKHGLKPVGPAFYNYRRINMAETLDVEAGIAVEKLGPEEGKVKNGTLPAGKFIGVSWTGHPDKLMTVTGMLIGWVKESGQKLDVEEKADGDHFACRLELYDSDPEEEPDMEKWVTTLAFKMKD
ncbi:effector-binding domain-containing protein [Devosia lucknowensis]|uniref:Effector-binding domain-containing protein n=1 Tax=Devosia lucknowensis TaxID=1096929 RepID=A0A1Y6EXQ6_9HYPH|nr:GyrI-like domain-containing protein [Devosia lucknowensis]SMQ65063.1 effector-binding domain-containing protein [Devosia lucknowensis]